LTVAEREAIVGAFAEARRTWESLAALQPERLAGRTPGKEDLAELEKRVGLHYEAVQALANALERAWTG
jgi:hypothetical protein